MPAHEGRPEWTVDMLEALPGDGQRYEIIDGELLVTRRQGWATSLPWVSCTSTCPTI